MDFRKANPYPEFNLNFGTGVFLFSTLPARPPLKGRPPPWKMKPQPGGGPAGRIGFNHPAWLAPRFFSAAPALCAQMLSTRPLTTRLLYSPKKNESRQVTWSDGAFQSFCAPNAGIIFSAGTLNDIEFFSGVWPCHSPNL
jgi:hypothetical protein